MSTTKTEVAGWIIETGKADGLHFVILSTREGGRTVEAEYELDAATGEWRTYGLERRPPQAVLDAVYYARRDLEQAHVTLHADNYGQPLCGARKVGVLARELSMYKVTCPACVARIDGILAREEAAASRYADRDCVDYDS